MHVEEAYAWLLQGLRRQDVLASLRQPLTPTQLSERLGFSLDTLTQVLRELTIYQLVSCLNPAARKSRVYGLSSLGVICRDRLARDFQLSILPYDAPATVDWNLYGWTCFNHRRTVLLTLEGPTQPAAIARTAARQHRPGFGERTELRMSANNCRDVVKLFLQKGIVEPVRIRGKGHIHFQLTAAGKELQRLLRRATSS